MDAVNVSGLISPRQKLRQHGEHAEIYTTKNRMALQPYDESGGEKRRRRVLCLGPAG